MNLIAMSRRLWIAMTALVPFLAQAQPQTTDSSERYSLPLVTSDELDIARSDQLLSGVAPGKSLLMRSASSLARALDLTKGRWAMDIIEPQVLAIRNSGLPF